MICDLCGEQIESGQAFSRCSEPRYSEQELELMGLEDMYQAFTCGLASHVDCIEAFSAPRQCCTPAAYPEGNCVEHAYLGPGFLCQDCRQWHQPDCFASEPYWYQGGRSRGAFALAATARCDFTTHCRRSLMFLWRYWRRWRKLCAL